jgi:transposase
MAGVRLSMRMIKEVLRLNSDGLSNRRIARIMGFGRTTVADYLRRAAAAGLSMPLPEELSEDQLENLLFPKPLSSSCLRPLPDFVLVHQELKKESVTLSLIWEEYKAIYPEGYQYSQFCELYRRWRAN